MPLQPRAERAVFEAENELGRIRDQALRWTSLVQCRRFPRQEQGYPATGCGGVADQQQDIGELCSLSPSSRRRYLLIIRATTTTITDGQQNVPTREDHSRS